MNEDKTIIKIMDNDEIRDFCIKKDLKIYELEKQLEQKENIIKEVREYIKNNDFYCKNQAEQEQYDKELLEILDKDIPKKSNYNYGKVEEDKECIIN